MDTPDQRDPSFTIPDEITVDLKKPLKKAAAGGEVLTALRFRPPTVGEMKTVARRQQSQGDADAGILLLSLLSLDGLTPPEIERLNSSTCRSARRSSRRFCSLIRLRRRGPIDAGSPRARLGVADHAGGGARGAGQRLPGLVERYRARGREIQAHDMTRGAWA